MNLHINCIRGSLILAFTFFLIFAAEAFAVEITIDSPTNATTISDTTPELNITTDEAANITYSWNNEGNISGCRNCTSFNTTYGENNGSDANLVALWHFNENFGNTTFDDSGNGNNGTLGNGTAGTEPVWTMGKFGPALDFDGSDDFVNVSNSPSLNLTGNLTMAAWVYPESWPNQAYIIGKKDAYAFRFYFGNLSFLFYNGTDWMKHDSNATVSLNQRSHVAATYNDSTVKLYINGIEVYSAPEAYTIATSDYFLTVGTILGITGLNSSYFDGIIDEVAIYNRSLPGAEIQELYNKSLSKGQHYVTVYATAIAGGANSTTKNFTVEPPVHNGNNSYWTIQEAINNANSSDTITVGAEEYEENVNVTKSVNIVGDGPANTVVRASNKSKPVFYIGPDANGTNISGLRIAWADYAAGIYIEGTSNVNVSNNIVKRNFQGIYLESSNNSVISNNNATLNTNNGILLNNSNGNTISGNNASDNLNYNGISVNYGNNNQIIDNTADSNKGNGIYLWSSSGNVIQGNNVSNSRESNGISIDGNKSKNLVSSDNIIDNNIVKSNEINGIGVWESENNTISNNDVTGNQISGIYQYASTKSTITNNNASSNGNTGIFLDTSSSNNITNNTANSNTNYDGIYLYNSSNNTIVNNTAGLDGKNGIFLDTSSNYNDIINNSFYGNYRDFASAGSSSNTITSNLFNGTRASFTYSGNISVNSTSPPAGGTPRNLTGIGKYLNVTNMSAAWVFLNISYADVELGETINDTLRMYRHNGSDWGIVNGSGMNNVTKYVYANITEFSVFAPLGNDSTPPRIAYNLDTTESGNYSQTWIFVNVSVNESNLDTVSLEIENNNNTNPETDGTNYWWNETLSEDTYTIKVYVNDTAGNTNVTDSRTIRVDTTSPIVTIVSPANATTTDSTPLLNATFGETVNTTWISIDGGAGQNYTTGVSNLTFDLDQLSDGPRNVTVYANDSANNTGSATIYFTVDTTPPNVTIDSPTNQTYDTSTIWINVTAWDNVEGSASTLNVTAELDGASNNSLTNQSGNWNYLWPDIEDGPHNITIYANDSVGNMNSTEVVYFTVDTTLPNVTIDLPLNTTITDTTPYLNFTVDESSNVTYNWNGEGNISGCRSCTSYNTTYGEYANSSEQNLSAVWHFNENFGNTTYDDSGNGNDGTLRNATWAPGRFGYGLKVNGSINDSYLSGIDVPFDASLDILDEDDGDGTFAFGVWFKLDQLASLHPDDKQNIIIAQEKGDGTGAVTWLQATKNSDKLTSWVGYETGDPWPTSTTVTVIDTWYFAVVNFNGTHISMYVNGDIEASVADTLVDKNANGTYMFGRTSNSTDEGINYINGTIDEIMFFDRSLSAAEIQELYNGTLADVQHNVTVYATDTAGNSNSTTRWFTVDTTPPIITVASPIDNKTYGIGNLDYKITVNEPISWANVSINGTKNMTMANSSLQYFNLSGDHPDLPEGTHNATFYVQDLMGYTNQTTVYFTVNISAPNINITSPENTTYGNGSLSYNMTITNDVNLTGARVEVNGSNYTLDNSSQYGWYNNITVGELGEGHYNATFYADSVLNNTEIVYFTVDASPPYDITLNYPENNSNISSSSITFKWTSYDNISTDLSSNLTINGFVNESDIDTPNGTLTLQQVIGISDDTYNWSITTWDQANRSNSSVTYYFTVDMIPPSVSFITPAINANLSGTVYVNVTVSDASTGVYNVSISTGGGWIEMSQSGGNISESNWSYIWNTSTVNDGNVILRINATDYAGASNITTRNVTVDNTPPNITVILPQNGTYGYNESLPLNFTATDPSGIVWCGYSPDGDSNVTIQSCQNTTFNVSGDGPHNITVYANDSAGNMNYSVSYFTVDTTPPVTTIGSPANDTIPDNTPDLNFTIDGPVNITYSWNGESNITGAIESDSFSTTYGESKRDANSSGLWHFNENYSSTITDDSGQSNHGIISGAMWTQGRFGSALYFDGSASVEVPDNNDTLDFSVNDSFTIGVWIKTDYEMEFILSKRENFPTSPGWELYLWDGMAKFKMKNSSGDTFVLSTIAESKLNDSNWHHAAVTYNGTSKNGSLYVDGNVVDSAINPVTGYTNNSLSLYIGRKPGSADYFFNGTIDDVHIMRRALSAAEIAAEYNRQLTDTPHNVTVYARDSAGNLNSTTRYFTVDATPPTIINPQFNETQINPNDIVRFNVTVTDDAGVDTVIATFRYPNATEVNKTLLNISNTYYYDWTDTSTDGVYNVTYIWANDTYGNVNATIHTGVSFIAEDSTVPTWDEPLIDQPAEANVTFTYDVNASDNAIVTYFINDTENFAINATSGVITNNTVLNFGNYSLNISVNDTSNHVNSTVITITVEDTIAPAITITSPADGEPFPSGTDTVTINVTIVEPNPDTLLIDWGFGGNTSYGYISSIIGPLGGDLSDGGIYTFYVWANDTSGNFNQTEVSISVNSGSDGGDSPGGSSPTTTLPTATVNNGTAVITFSSIDVGSPATFDVPETEDVYITRVFLAVKKKVTDVKLTVSTLDTRPATIKKDATGITYKYMDIVHENANDADVSIAILTFKVEKSWFDDNSIDQDSITLNRYSEDAWTILTTTKLSCDFSYCYYEAGSPGLSVFSISGSIVTTTATTTGTTTTIASSTPTSTVTGQTSGSLMTPAPVGRPPTKVLLGEEGKPLNKTVIAVVIVLIIVIAAYMYYRHRKREGKWWEDQIKSTED